MKKICVFLIISVFFLSSLSVVYSEETKAVKTENFILDSIYYDDEDYLYFKADTQMVRFKKDFSGSYEILSVEEKKSIVDKMEKRKESLIVK